MKNYFTTKDFLNKDIYISSNGADFKSSLNQITFIEYIKIYFSIKQIKCNWRNILLDSYLFFNKTKNFLDSSKNIDFFINLTINTFFRRSYCKNGEFKKAKKFIIVFYDIHEKRFYKFECLVINVK